MKPFKQFLREGRDPRQFSKYLENKYPGVVVELYYGNHEDILQLSSIVVPKEERKTGIGSQVMEELVGYADKMNMTLTLTPSRDFGATSVERLKKFYSRFGFVRNKGRKKDYRIFDVMYRRPQ